MHCGSLKIQLKIAALKNNNQKSEMRYYEFNIEYPKGLNMSN